MVADSSAQLFWPRTQRYPIPSDHTGMIKFLSPSDRTYLTVVRLLRTCIQNQGKNTPSANRGKDADNI